MKEIILNKQLPVVTMNFEDVKNSLISTVERYKDIIVTEDGLKDCKSTQKELAGLRNKIETYRKSVKKEMEQPIKEFEKQCKELTLLISDAELPIKEGIATFDEKRRLEKVKKAMELIQESVQAHNLNAKYAAQISIHSITINLSNSMKSIKEEIESKVSTLARQQEEEIRAKEVLKQSIEATLETVNTTIKTQLKYEDFQRYIDMKWSLAEIIREINNRAETIRRAEQPKPIVQEQPKEIEKTVVQSIQEEAPKVIEPVKENESLYFVDIKVIHTRSRIAELSKFLKENGYDYQVKSKGDVTE